MRNDLATDDEATDLRTWGGEAYDVLVEALPAPIIATDTSASLRSPSVRCVRLATGRRMKIRKHRSAARAAEVMELRQGLDDQLFSRIHACRRQFTIETWVEGRTLDEQSSSSGYLSGASKVLAVLHTVPSAGGRDLPSEGSTAVFVERLVEGLEFLRTEAIIDVAEADWLRMRATKADPGRALFGLTHTDLAPDNLVVDEQGQVVCIDFESLWIGPIQYDFARTRYLWSMDNVTWATFARSYSAHGGGTIDEAGLPFWALAGIVGSARHRICCGGDMSLPIRALQDLLREDFWEHGR